MPLPLLVSTDPALTPTTLDCVCWPEGATMGSPFRCAPCVDAAVLLDALDYDPDHDNPVIRGVTIEHVQDAVERVAPDQLEGDPTAVLRALVGAMAAWGLNGATEELLAYRGRYASQLRRTRTGLRPLPPERSWTEDYALRLLHGPTGIPTTAATA